MNRLQIAKAQLKDVGYNFLTAFASQLPSTVPLRSRFPAACWPSDDDRTSYYSIVEYFGPHTSDRMDELLLVRLCVNRQAPPGLLYRLRGRMGNQQVRVSAEPSLELITTADEMADFGAWLQPWLEGQRTGALVPPVPPHALGDDGDHKPATGWQPDTWRRFNYLWTQKALAVDIWS